jgi:HlyD family secretion protein
MKRRHILAALLALMTVGLLAGCGGAATVESESAEAVPVVSQEDDKVIAEAAIEPARWAELRFEPGGAAVEVLVQEGDVVAEDDLLVQFDPIDAQLAVQEAQAALASAQARLAQVKVPPRPEAVAVAEARLTVAEGALAQAAAQRDQLAAGATDAEVAAAQAQLEAAQGGAGAQLRAARAAVDSATAQRDAAQAQLDLAQAGSTPEQVAAAQAQVTQAEAALATAQAALERTEIRAPFAGTVVEVSVDAGDTARPGQVIVVLATLDRLQARTVDLTELDVARVAEGQPVVVKVDALPDAPLSGHVLRIDEQSEDYRGDVVYPVIVELDGDAPELRWGMTAMVEIEAK